MDVRPVKKMRKVKISEALVRFIKTRNILIVAGEVRNPEATEYGLWLGAILHRETMKLVMSTPPAFKTKKQALEFIGEMVSMINQNRTTPGSIIELS